MDKIEKDARANTSLISVLEEKKHFNDLQARQRRFDAIKNASSMSHRHTETEMPSAAGNDSNDKEDKESRVTGNPKLTNCHTGHRSQRDLTNSGSENDQKISEIALKIDEIDEKFSRSRHLRRRDEFKISSPRSQVTRAWFKKPKYMSTIVYNYFGRVIKPIIQTKTGRSYSKHALFTGTKPESPSTTGPRRFFLPRVFLWLPHLFVEKLHYPNCNRILEKNGALAPRRVTNYDGPFFINKMGPSGVHSLLYEAHTRRYNTLLLQYLEIILERELDLQAKMDAAAAGSAGMRQQTLTNLVSLGQFPEFGSFGAVEGYGGYVPSERYLSAMLNKVIERDERDAAQHTSCIPPHQLAQDDSYKVTKHMAQEDGLGLCTGLFTCMADWFIRAQALTMTKAHEERLAPLLGIANSARRLGYDEPEIIFSDDPVKDKRLLESVFPSIATGLTLIAVAHSLHPFTLAPGLTPLFLSTSDLVEASLAPFIRDLDDDDTQTDFLCISLDAEWNPSRTVGVSIIQMAPHTDPSSIFIIPVHHFRRLPPSLLCLLMHERVFKIGSGVKGDLTRLRKQFTELKDQVFEMIELKDYAIQRGILKQRESGSLDAMVQKLLGKYLSKDPNLRCNENWEQATLAPDLLMYAASDVFASRLLFEAMSRKTPLPQVTRDTPAGTQVAFLVQEGGEIAAISRIAADQPSSLGGVRVAVPTQTRVVVDVETIRIPSAAVFLHQVPRNLAPGQCRTRMKAGAKSLDALQTESSSDIFPIVAHISQLSLHCDDKNASSLIPISEADPSMQCSH
ncbi:hypothetical protein BDZ89DRAFT_1112423 [Hymenopellis radicata]|nr:hypothetical protein BDZ89DRAFT_1112423 [Hymenopellis radicata]